MTNRPTLPLNGSVVLIDDNPEEAMPIIQAFSKAGVAVRYYNGIDEEAFPNETLLSVRVLLLDLQLFAGVSDPHMICSSLLSVLRKLLVPQNGPYILILWSKKEELYRDSLQEHLQDAESHLTPIAVLSLPKVECIESLQDTNERDQIIEEFLGDLSGSFNEDELRQIKFAAESRIHLEEGVKFRARPNAIKVIEHAIEKEFKKIGLFELFLIWENAARIASTMIVSDISSHIPTDGSWLKNINSIIVRMAAARTGVNEVSQNTLIQNAFSTLNTSFADRIESQLRDLDHSKKLFVDSEIVFGFYDNGQEYIIKKSWDRTFTISLVGSNKGLLTRQAKNLFLKAIPSWEFAKGSPSVISALGQELASYPENSIEACEKEITLDGKKFTLKVLSAKKKFKCFKDGEILQAEDKLKTIVNSLASSVPAINASFTIYDSIPSKLNTSLHLEINPDQTLIPGNIYEHSPSVDQSKKQKYLQSYFDEIKGNLDDFQLVDLEVSPVCDYAQDKWKRSRVLPGVIYLDREDLKAKKKDNLYDVEPSFLINGVKKKMVFDFHLFKSDDKANTKARTVFYRLKRELLLDIIAKLSSHVNRPGISFIS